MNLTVAKINNVFTFTESPSGLVYYANEIFIDGSNVRVVGTLGNKYYPLKNISFNDFIYPTFNDLYNELKLYGFQVNNSSNTGIYQFKDVLSLPTIGNLSTRYLVGSDEYYWNGTEFIKIEPRVRVHFLFENGDYRDTETTQFVCEQ